MANKPKHRLTKKEIDDIKDAIEKRAVAFPDPTIIRHPQWNSRNTTINYTTSTWPSGHVLQLPMEDLELSDMQRVRDSIESMMDAFYPPFEPEIVHAPDKDYFLPALKVLVYKDGEYFSPQQKSKWANMELEATCVPSPWSLGRPTAKYLQDGQVELGFESVAPHAAPNEDCECGIYGSVNLEEVQSYLTEESAGLQRYFANYGYDESDPIIRNKLCVIEPTPGAKVILCRKGWKASGAFISEIINETISLEEASNLLSIAWKREIDVRKVCYEDR